jgi:hypothetical protein
LNVIVELTGGSITVLLSSVQPTKIPKSAKVSAEDMISLSFMIALL